MEKRFATSLVIAVSMVASVSFAAPLLGPEGEFSALFGSLEYDPSKACYKPTKPYDNDRFAWENYQSQAMNYVSCLERAANADMRYANAVIQEGYKNSVDEFMSEMRRGY